MELTIGCDQVDCLYVRRPHTRNGRRYNLLQTSSSYLKTHCFGEQVLPRRLIVHRGLAPCLHPTLRLPQWSLQTHFTTPRGSDERGDDSL
jgi:hypothetical protein